MSGVDADAGYAGRHREAIGRTGGTERWAPPSGRGRLAPRRPRQVRNAERAASSVGPALEAAVRVVRSFPRPQAHRPGAEASMSDTADPETSPPVGPRP